MASLDRVAFGVHLTDTRTACRQSCRLWWLEFEAEPPARVLNLLFQAAREYQSRVLVDELAVAA